MKEAKESETKKKTKKMSSESSIFSTILSDIEKNPTILQKQSNFSAKVSIFTTILDDFDELSPKILQKTKKKPDNFTPTVPKTLTRSDVIDNLNQELKILKSEIESNDQTSDRFVSRACKCVEEKFLGEEVLESETLNSENSIDEMLPTMLGDEDNEEEEDCGEIDEFIEEMLEKIEEDRSYLDRVKDDFVFGGLLEDLLRERLREKEEEEKEISSWITNGEPETETEKIDIKKSEKKKKKIPVKVQESSLSGKRDSLEYRKRLYLLEKLRERDENKRKRRMKALRFGVEFSYLMAEYMFLRPNDVLANETDEFWLCLKRLGVDKDDKGTNVIIRKLEEVIDMVMRKKENKEHYKVDFPESSFQFEDYIRLCADVIQVLGKIVWTLRRNQTEKLEVSVFDSLFQDCEKLLMKLDLKIGEMKQSVYRSVSADYESFSKSERFDMLLRSKVINRVNADNRFQRSMIGSYLVEIWKPLFQSKALHEESK